MDFGFRISNFGFIPHPPTRMLDAGCSIPHPPTHNHRDTQKNITCRTILASTLHSVLTSLRFNLGGRVAFASSCLRGCDVGWWIEHPASSIEYRASGGRAGGWLCVSLCVSVSLWFFDRHNSRLG
jgi:hypothetical protein